MAKVAERVGSAREGAVSAAQVPRRRRRAKVPAIGLDAAAALPAAVAVSARVTWFLKLRREQVRAKRADTRRKKPSREQHRATPSPQKRWRRRSTFRIARRVSCNSNRTSLAATGYSRCSELSAPAIHLVGCKCVSGSYSAPE
jgi:hypothetical protein